MYMLSEDVDMKAKVATLARRLEELELKKMHEVQAISDTQVHVMPCTICQSCDHVVDECQPCQLWRNHPNFSWKPRPPPYQPQGQTQAPQQPSSVEQAIANLNNIQYSISRLTNLNTVNEKGKFPSQPSQNPKGVHEVETQDETLIKESKNQEEQSGKKSASKSSIEEEPRIVIKEDMMKKHMPPPFPQALHGKKEIKNSSEILEGSETSEVKRGLQVTKNAFLTEQVSAIIQSKSPVKYKDPGCPTISVNIGGTHVEKALLDLGQVSQNPKGVIEDVLVQVDKFYYPVDFVVLDTDSTVKEENYVPIILGRPFLATSNAIINCRNGVMQLTFGNMTLELNIFHYVRGIFTLKRRKDLRSVLDQHFAIMSPWRRREEILPLFNQEDSQGVAVEDPPKLILKPLPVDLKYAYLEDDEKCPVVVSSTSLVIKRIVF
ncbi:hypothetical protein CK203_094105 [Vitis vinifera]|uniref:Uncharacterized protein n=1 Tax=Vitis vinifera TaxID=29760 RepID=A0A438CXN5_VITVI|nr:hypothetical protein CK203_094105 [Vitis vinifera]